MDIFRTANTDLGLTKEEIRAALLESLEGRDLKKVLILPPDISRFHSGAGFIANTYYHTLTQRGVHVDVMPALGTHEPMTAEQFAAMYGDIPYSAMVCHHFKTEVVKLGEISGQYMASVTEGLWTEPLTVEVNRRLVSGEYDLILSVGQVVPHEVIGMSNHTKNIFVGAGGSDMINKSHMVGAVYGLERMMGFDKTPVRLAFDKAFNEYLADKPITFVLTVTTVSQGETVYHGLFIGEGRRCYEEAVALASVKNITHLPKRLQKCVAYMDPHEFHTTWIGNKSVYRTRMAMADGGELIVLAPGVCRFGENDIQETLIRKYGYRGCVKTMESFRNPENTDLRENMGVAAHIIHSSPDDRFTVTYAVRDISQEEILSVGFGAADYEEMAKRYDPKKLSYGFNTMPDGEEVYFIPNPAIGLWMADE